MNRSEPILDNEYYHVYNRGNRRQPIFGDASDYLSFIGKLCESSWKYKVCVVVFTLMPNHFHLILRQTDGGSTPRFMVSVETSAAKRFDLKYGKVGHLFQGRYPYIRIDSDESLLVVARYIHLNPVVAGLAKRPEDWPYSDYLEHSEVVHQPDLNREEGRLLPRLNRGEGRLLPYTPKEYVEFVRSLSGGALQKASFI